MNASPLVEDRPTRVARVRLPRRPFSISLTLTIFILALMSLIVAVCAYRLTFGGSFASSSDEWARFGEYLGGVLSPLFSLFALVGVLWTVMQTQQQQIDTTFFYLVQRLGQIRDAEVSRATPGVTPNIYTASHAHQVPMQGLVREAWQELTRQLKMKTESTEGAAEEHMAQVVGYLRKKYGDVFRLTDKILQLYRFIHRAPLSAATASYYVEIVNSEVTSIEQTLLLFALVTQPAKGAVCAVMNDLNAFIALGLDEVQMPPAYMKALRARFPHLPRSVQDRPMLLV